MTHWRVTLWLYYSTVQWKFKSHSIYLPTQLSRECVRLGIERLLVRAHCAPLFFFQQCSPVGIYIFTGEDPQSEWMKRGKSNFKRVHGKVLKKNLAKGNNPRKRRPSLTKLKLNLVWAKIFSNTKFQFNVSKGCREKSGKLNFSKGQ